MRIGVIFAICLFITISALIYATTRREDPGNCVQRLDGACIAWKNNKDAPKP